MLAIILLNASLFVCVLGVVVDVVFVVLEVPETVAPGTVEFNIGGREPSPKLLTHKHVLTF